MIMKGEFLGNFRITLNGEEISSSISEKGNGILCYLMLHAGHRVQRKYLSSLMWDQYTQKSASGNLRYVLWQIRKVLKSHCPDTEYLTSPTKSTIEIPEAYVKTDVSQYDYWIRMSRNDDCNKQDQMACLKKASELYNGHFLEGFYIYDVPLFSDWLFNNRESLQRMYLENQMRLAEKMSRFTDFKGALKELDKLTKLDDLNEEVHAHMIRCHLKSGNRAAAVNLYRDLKRRLRQELGISPSTELQELYQTMLKTDYQISATNDVQVDVTSQPSSEWEQPKRCMLFYQSSTPTGIQAVNQVFNQLDDEKDILVLNICASPGKRIQYEGIYEIVDSLKKHYSEKMEVESFSFYEEIDELAYLNGLDQYQIFNRLTDLLSNLDHQKVCIKVWNLHFMDERSIDFISFLYRRYSGQQIKICGIYDTNWHNQRFLHFKKAFSNEPSVTFEVY